MATAPNRDDDSLEAIEADVVVGQDGPAPSIDDLVEKGDAESLVALGIAHRTGTAHVARDVGLALESFAAAAALGHPEAERIVGLAHFRGLGVPQDQAKGAAHLRTAAQNGSLRAKVLVANLYEMGVHYAADAEKADVWYRNVARAAGLEQAPDSREHVLAMAALGCVRDCLKLVADDSLPSKDRAQWLKKAKALGYSPGRTSTTPGEPSGAKPGPNPQSSPGAQSAGTQSSGTQSPTAPKPVAKADSTKGEPTPAKPAADPKVAAAEPKSASEPKRDASADGKKATPNAGAKKATPNADDAPEPEVLLGAQWTVVPGVLAGLATAFFGVASFLGGSLAVVGARSLASTGSPIPLIGNRFEIVLLAIVAALGIAPTAPLYRARVFIAGALLAMVAGAGGWFLFDALPLLWNRGTQSAVFALGAFLVLVLIGGAIGGTRARPPPAKETRKVHDPIRLLPPQYPKVPADD